MQGQAYCKKKVRKRNERRKTTVKKPINGGKIRGQQKERKNFEG